MSAKRGLFIAPFDELSDPKTLVELARRAEQSGWDGFFLWDHVSYRPPVEALADAWIALAAIAGATERIRLGPLVTPLSRRRVAEIAPGQEAGPWEAAGATWVLTDFEEQPRLREVEAIIDAGPGD